jgi:hypothetical protein
MKIRNRLLIFFLFLPMLGGLTAQTAVGTEQETTPLFRDAEPLQIRLAYSNRELLRDTDDTTYLKTVLHYRLGEADWDSLPVKIRARGNFRKANCFLSPVKIEIKKKNAKGTLFEGNKELKLVYPCANNAGAADYVLKEYLAYKLYEPITPYHFKTRRLQLEYTDQRNRKEKVYQLGAFIIEDIDNVAERNQGKKLKRSVHPLEQDDICSIQNDFFQFMIANTDFSVAFQHNEKLVFVNGRKAIPIPYDFDMAGMVNTHYAVVSEIQNEQLQIDKVTQRLFRGFKRDPGLYDSVRNDFLSKEAQLMDIINSHESDFQNPSAYEKCRDFIADFFKILRDNKSYRSQILAMARTK